MGRIAQVSGKPRSSLARLPPKSQTLSMTAADQSELARELGYKAYRARKFTEARRHFEQALRVYTVRGDAAETATAHGDLAAALSALGDHGAALRHHEAAVKLLGTSPPSIRLCAALYNLGLTQRELGEGAAARASVTQAAKAWPPNAAPIDLLRARIISTLGTWAREQGDTVAALAYHSEASEIRHALQPPSATDAAASMNDLAMDYLQAGDFAAAEAQWTQARKLLQEALGSGHPSLAPLLNNLGVAYRNQRKLEAAAYAFAGALAAQPALLSAQHNLAAVLTRLGRHDEARRHRDQALARQNVFIQRAPAVNAPRVLILSGADAGNVPVEHLLPDHAITRIWWFPAHGAASKATALPHYDLVFNGIGDPDLAGPNDAAITAFLRGCKQPVLNPPDRVAQTRRDRLPGLLAGIPDCLVPPVSRLDAPAEPPAIESQLTAAGITPPLLMRPAGMHGGVGLQRVDHWNDLASQPRQTGVAYYASPFIDCRAADGYVRKYRIAFVDRQPYPYHLAISPRWLVHYFSADMEAHAWKLAEEAAFLADWRGVLGAAAADAITEIGRRIDLEFCGVDFSVLPDGRVVIFEANATMLIHPETATGPFGFKNASVEAIVVAVRRMLDTRCEAIEERSSF
jgi:tetratricopeptide (TPR) repeat protein